MAVMETEPKGRFPDPLARIEFRTLELLWECDLCFLFGTLLQGFELHLRAKISSVLFDLGPVRRNGIILACPESSLLRKHAVERFRLTQQNGQE
jgi:hypothetical protein